MTTTAPMRPPRQERSQATLQRIEDASFALLAAGGWDNVTVNGIGRATGVSRGAFYARFPSRATLLDFVRERYHCALNAAEQEAFRQVDPLSTHDLRTVVEGVVGAVDAVVARFGSIMVSLSADRDERAASGMARSILFDRYSRTLLAAADQITRDDPAAAVAFTFRVVFETLAFSARDPDSVPPPLRREPDGYRRDLAAMVFAYLTAPT